MQHPRFLVPAALLGAITLPQTTPAQLPPGHFAVGAGQTQPPFTAWTGPPGVYVGHPRTPGMMRAVTGLPASLTQPAPNTPTNGWYGIGGMSRHEPSGDLLIGDIPHGTTSNPVHLYRVRVNMQTLVATVLSTFQLGMTVPPNGGVNQIAQIDANRVVVTCNNVNGAVGTGPMAIAEVNLSTGAITPWSVSTAFGAGAAEAICVDRVGGFAYLSGAPTIYSVPLTNPTPANLQPIAMVPIFVDKLEWDASSGTIVAGGRSGNPSNGAVFRIDPVTGTVTTLLPNWQSARTIALEPATSDILMSGIQSVGASQPGIWHLPSAGSPNPTFLSNSYAPAGALGGIPMGLVLAPDPGYYGSATAMQSSMPLLPWSHGVLPGGLPLVGNQAFALQLDLPSGGTVTQFAAASLAAANTPFPGTPLQVYVGLNAPQFLGVLVHGAPTLPLPIPNSPGLQGLSIYFQSLTVANFNGASTTIGASDGARVTIL